MHKTDNRGRILFAAWLILILLLLGALFAQVSTVHAQATETPTPEPTADVDYNLQLSSGNEIEISRSIDYGQIGIIAALGVVALLLMLIGLFNLVAHYLR